MYHIQLVGVSLSNLVTTQFGAVGNGKGPVEYMQYKSVTLLYINELTFSPIWYLTSL